MIEAFIAFVDFLQFFPQIIIGLVVLSLIVFSFFLFLDGQKGLKSRGSMIFAWLCLCVLIILGVFGE